MTTLSASMHARWIALCDRVGRAADASVLARELERLYVQPVRAYHSLAHIAACLTVFDQHRSAAIHADAVEFALWLHDCIYDPESKDNEARSAAVAGIMLHDLGAPGSFRESVTRLIMATLHNGEPLHGDAALLADIDLSILGSPPAEYSAYAAAIRTEYAFAPDKAYREGRAAVLRSFLGRNRIYQTDQLLTRFEARARANMESELRRLIP